MPLKIAPINLILIMAATAVILSDFNQGIIITLLGGILLDFASALPDGILSISLLITYLILYFALQEILSKEANRFILVSTVAAGTIVFFLVLSAVVWMFGVLHISQNVDTQHWLIRLMPLTLIWNLIFVYPIFFFYSLVQNLIFKIPKNEEVISVQ